MGSNYQIELIELIDLPGLMSRTWFVIRDGIVGIFAKLWQPTAAQGLWTARRHFYVRIVRSFNAKPLLVLLELVRTLKQRLYQR